MILRTGKYILCISKINYFLGDVINMSATAKSLVMQVPKEKETVSEKPMLTLEKEWTWCKTTGVCFSQNEFKCFGDTFILQALMLILKIKNFQGDITSEVL